MKLNDYLLLAAGSAFSYLFYDQNAGINFLVFDLLFICLLLFRDPHLVRQPKWLWMTSLCIISGVGILISSSALAIISNALCILTLAAVSFNPKTSTIVSFFWSVISVALAIFSIVDSFFRSPKTDQPKAKLGLNLLIAAIVIVLTVIFFLMYKSANPLFAANTAWINLDFLSMAWLFFTLMGFIACYGLLHIRTLPAKTQWGQEHLSQADDILHPNKDRVQLEKTVASWLFFMLNVMLVILNAGDINTLYFGGKLPEGISHSDFVHNGVGNSIFSIILATSIIVYVLRKSASSQTNHKWLHVFVIVWIFQTLLMLIDTADRNLIYIQAYNLTYKRIGVFVWLCLAAVGLLILSLKVVKSESFIYLVRKNFATWLSLLAISSVINWDAFIVKYNLAHKPIEQVDFRYILNLSDAVLPELIKIRNKKDYIAFNTKSLASPEHLNFNARLSHKINDYVKTYKTTWQSWDLRDQEITHLIVSN